MKNEFIKMLDRTSKNGFYTEGYKMNKPLITNKIIKDLFIVLSDAVHCFAPKHQSKKDVLGSFIKSHSKPINDFLVNFSDF
jgi:hypothetical protein